MKLNLLLCLCVHRLVSQQRHFTEAGQYKPITKEIRGMMELQQYQDVARGDQRVETLRQSGLTDSEIRLQLNKEGMDKGLDPVVNMMVSLLMGHCLWLL